MFLSTFYIIYFKIKDFIVDFSNLSIFYLILLNFIYLFLGLPFSKFKFNWTALGCT